MRAVFDIEVSSTVTHKPECDVLDEIVAELARAHLRSHVTPPRTSNDLESMECGVLLPVVHCAFQDCERAKYITDFPKDAGDENVPSLEESFRHAAEHRFDVCLKEHVMSTSARAPRAFFFRFLVTRRA